MQRKTPYTLMQQNAVAAADCESRIDSMQISKSDINKSVTQIFTFTMYIMYNN